jgi:apolipoprotein N-acyltransferase
MHDASAQSSITGSLTGYNTLLVIVAGLASAGLLYFGTGLHPIWGLLWVAPVPVLAIAPRLPSTAAFLLGSIAWFLGEMNQWNYLRHVIALPLHTIILFLAISAAVFGLGVLFTRSFLRRGSLLLAAFAFPVYWVSCEYLNAMASPHSTWGNLAYTQMDFLATDPDRFGHWSLGNQLRSVFVCRYSCGTL